MTLSKALALGIGLVVAGLATSSRAATMTFDDLPSFGFTVETYTENGITAEAAAYGGLGDLYAGPFPNHGELHLDERGASEFTDSVMFSMERRFSANSFDIIPYENLFCADPACSSYPQGDPHLNVQVEGYRSGVPIALEAFFMGYSESTYLFSSAFTDLDALTVSIVRPDWFSVGGSSCQGGLALPCAHFDIDNLTLSPVPIPAALPLFASALAGMGFFGWRRRRMAAA